MDSMTEPNIYSCVNSTLFRIILSKQVIVIMKKSVIIKSGWSQLCF